MRFSLIENRAKVICFGVNLLWNHSRANGSGDCAGLGETAG
jgi:hypothetical protein